MHGNFIPLHVRNLNPISRSVYKALPRACDDVGINTGGITKGKSNHWYSIALRIHYLKVENFRTNLCLNLMRASMI